jgi:cyclin-dependent kinase
MLNLSKEDYDAACAALNGKPALGSPTDAAPGTVCVSRDEGPGTHPGEPGVRIGPYQDCNYVASGVTAEVYRAKDRALKVIVETRDIEPHSPAREAKILGLLHRPCIPLLETFRDQEQRFVLVFPYMPLTLSTLLDGGSPLADSQIRSIFTDLLTALRQIHSQGIIHRDIKPSAVLLASPSGPACLSDFGTAWHPELSAFTEPADAKILDIGTGPYRAPEVLFGNKSYGTAVDMWGTGSMLAECCRRPSPKPLFESRAVHEDGNQLGLILSIFKTMGSPTRETWPEAAHFKTPPFDIYRVFERRAWEEILPEVSPQWRELVSALVRYNSGRATAEQASTQYDGGPLSVSILLIPYKALQYACLHEAGRP